MGKGSRKVAAREKRPHRAEKRYKKAKEKRAKGKGGRGSPNRLDAIGRGYIRV